MATYIRLTDYKSSDEKEQEFFNPKNRYEAKQDDFSKIPNSPIAYWVKEVIKKSFENSLLGAVIPVKKGMDTGDNDTYLKLWFEVEFSKIGINLNSRQETITLSKKWVPYNKGGEFQKWYGNKDFLVNWDNDGEELRVSTANLRSKHLYFKNGITWNALTSNTTSARFSDYGALFDSAGSSMFPEENINYFLSFMNSKIVDVMLRIINPTLNYGAGTVGNLPIIFPEEDSIKQKIETLTQQNIDISKQEWDSRETSWDFTKNELIKHKLDGRIETAYSNYCDYWSEKFVALHNNEEELNKLFIDIYELGDELDEYVEFEDITILKNETKIEQILIPPSTKEESDERDKTAEGYLYNRGAQLVFKADEIMKQFISYGVGVMFGRYALDSDGLLIANMDQEVPTDTTFEIDDDNVIPVLEDDYFKDDIASRFVQFVKVVFGEKDLNENIKFIEDSLGTTLRKYFVKGFYEDHIKRYKKRPIYWMVASPKKGFMSLMYMHRYQSDVFATVQNGYLREYITKLEAAGEDAQREADDPSNSSAQRNRASKRVEKIGKTLDEIIKFDRETLTAYAQDRLEIDLDDGVKVNYCKFKDVLYEFDKKLCK